jgi:[protein-PII] uridylyltransferase
MSESREPYLKKLREAHRAFAPEDARLIQEIRTTVRMETDLVEHDEARSGLDEARARAAIADGVVTSHLDAIARPEGLLALAVGGYGRGELSPFSDIDLMILVPNGREASREAAARLVRFLWDVGFQLGHAVRTLEKTAEVMAADIPSATAVLESRHLWGDPGLARRLSDEVVTPYLMSSREPYVEAKIREMRDRHRFYGGSPCIVEPNVKESPGGLRDMHVAQWIARARTGRRDFSELRQAGAITAEGFADVMAAYATAHRVRHVLHRLAGSRQDVLDAATQPPAAAALGFTDEGGRIGAEDLMRMVTGAARRIHQFLDEGVAFHEIDLGGGRRSTERRDIGSGFVAVGNGLYLVRGDVFEGEGAARRMMRAFLIAQRHRLTVGEEIVIAIRRHAAGVGDAIRSDPEVIQTFRSLLQGRRGVGGMLRAMHASSLLGELLPEFGELTGLVRIDGYHRYTVDEHSLRTVEALEGFEDPEADVFLRDELLRVLRPDLLRLAALLHDIGKAAGPDHEAAGASRAVETAHRLGFGEDETQILCFLLRHHTLLAETADRRVLDEETVKRIGRIAGSAERLRLLFLLNLADVRAIGGEALCGWRLEQIRRLYERVRGRLETLPQIAHAGSSFVERLAEAAGKARTEAVVVHAGLVPSRYRVEVEPEIALRHLDMIERLREVPAAVLLLPGPTSSRLWFASRDEGGRFAHLAGVLTAAGLDVRSAGAFTRRDGIVLDVFDVTDEAGEPVRDPDLAAKLERDLADAWSGAIDLHASVRARTARFRAGGAGTPAPVKVNISNKVSGNHTVIDVVAGDRPGLLYDLTLGIASHGLDIRFARVATRGDRIADAFYVAGRGGRVEDESLLDRLRQTLLEVVAS